MALASCFASSVVSSVVVKDANEGSMAPRVFLGRVVKLGYFEALFSDYKYSLYDKDRCIACLDFKEKVRSPEILKTFVGKNVIIKGTSRLINREPYLVITVDDVCEQ